MAKFINPFTDIGFKRIFGQEPSKPLLIDFLNNLLKGEREIKDLTFLDKEQTRVFDEDRSLIYDVYCQLENGEKIIVEMQNRTQPFFKNRSIYYTAEAIARQGERGIEWAYGIKAVYFIGFLNFRMENAPEKLRTDVALMDMQEKAIFSDKIRMIFLQLPYFKKEFEECKNDYERWICVLKDMEVLDRMPQAARTSVFERLKEIADISTMSREEREKYDYAIKKYRDTCAVMMGAKEEGIQEGIEKGIEKGRTSVISTLLANGMPMEDIIKFYHITEAELHRLLGK